MTEITLQINRPEDISLVQQLAQRLGIVYFQKTMKNGLGIKRKRTPKKNPQMEGIEAIEKLRVRFKKYRIPAETNINQLIDQMMEP